MKEQQHSSGVEPQVPAGAWTFVDAVQQLPHVRTVLLERTGSGLRISTVIDADPVERSYRDPIYAAELALLDTYQGDDLDLRVLNVQQTPREDDTQTAPASACVLYQR